MVLFGLRKKNILIEIFRTKMKTKNKKIEKERKKEKFYSTTEVEKEFFPVETAKEKEAGVIDNIEKKIGSKLMTDILSSYLR